MAEEIDSAPIRTISEHDAQSVAVLDSAPIGGILTDASFDVIHASVAAVRLTGIADRRAALVELLAKSRLVQPSVARDFVEALKRGGPMKSLHVAEDESGQQRCVSFTAARGHGPEPRWIFWVQDVTDSARAHQFQLLAEVGRAREPGETTQSFAEHLADAALRILGVDIAVVALGDEQRLRAAATRGLLLREDALIRPREHAYVAKAFEAGHAVVSDGSEWDGDGHEMTGTHFIVPLLAYGRAVGTLHISNLSHDVGFNPLFDADFLQALSAYAGAAIANARLFEEVRAEQLKLSTVLDNMADAVLLFTADGDVLAANNEMLRLTERDWMNLNTDRRNYRICSETGEPLRRDDWPFFKARRQHGPIVDERYMIDFGDRQKYISVTVLTVPASGSKAGPTYVGTIRDITADRIAQHEREAFVQMVTHELRGPLTPLRGFLQMVRKQAEAEEQIDADIVRRAERQVARLTRLIDRLLDLSRVERGVELDTHPVDLCELVSATTELWHADPRGSDLTVRLTAPSIIVDGDPDRLEQVLTNLLDNAVKHSAPHGEIVVSVAQDAGSVVLRVTDRGSGIPPEHLPRIFDRFYSAPGSPGGMGIGLYVTKELVTAHRGEISVISEVGAGTCFEVRLPSASHYR